MQITIASGKGGTGKTTISVALASYISRTGVNINLLDCDVEEPNANLFLKAPIDQKNKVYIKIPEVNLDLCNGCGKCDNICEFSAIVMVKNSPLVLPDMCHSCGGCTLVCPKGAIKEIEKEIGLVEHGKQGNINYYGGRLNIGEIMTPSLISSVKTYISEKCINIIDSPPGTSCPVIESIHGSDYVILVTEPTPFGLHDLTLAVGLVREVNIPFSVLINRSDIGDKRVEEFCKKEGVEIIASIPDSRNLAENYSRGEFIDFFLENYSNELENIVSTANLKYNEK